MPKTDKARWAERNTSRQRLSEAVQWTRPTPKCGHVWFASVPSFDSASGGRISDGAWPRQKRRSCRSSAAAGRRSMRSKTGSRFPQVRRNPNEHRPDNPVALQHLTSLVLIRAVSPPGEKKECRAAALHATSLHSRSRALCGAHELRFHMRDKLLRKLDDKAACKAAFAA